MNAIDTVFEWVLAATLRASVLAVAILGLQLLFRGRLPAGWRYALWLPMLAVLVLPVLPSTPFGLYPRTVEKAGIFSSTREVAIMEGALHPAEETADGAVSVIAKRSPLAIAWFAGTCVMLAVGAAGYRRNMRRVRKSSRRPDAELGVLIAHAAREAGLARPPRTLVSPAVDSPAVTGLMRPMLLLPAGFPEGLNTAETRLILLHELSHVKRLDLPLNGLACGLLAMHWFNPLLWFVFARIRVDREVACDAAVLSIDTADHRAEYGGALLKLQGMASPRALALGFIGIFERGAEMKSRIREISAHRPRRFIWQAAGGVMVAVLMMFGATTGREIPGDTPADVAGAGSEERKFAGKAADTAHNLIIPAVDFEDIFLREAVDFLNLRARQLSKDAPAFPIVIDPSVDADTKVVAEIRLRDAPLSVVLKYCAEGANVELAANDEEIRLIKR